MSHTFAIIETRRYAATVEGIEDPAEARDIVESYFCKADDVPEGVDILVSEPVGQIEIGNVIMVDTRPTEEFLRELEDRR